MDKKLSRIKRGLKARSKMKELGVTRLVVYRTPRHIYAQIVDVTGATVIASASSLEKEFKTSDVYTGNKVTANKVGELVAKRALEKGIDKVAFDRSGFKYHGRVASLAQAAREAGLHF